MTSKCALIVDDSRTARQVLGAALSGYGLRVEHAASAEEALEFLGRSRPDVIFMDHNMPGMDGLQAVRAIKANPATATIPIMMYTSQEGELYVGQARALGAVGVLPKQIKPVEVSQALRSLHLIEPTGEDSRPAARPASAPEPSPEPAPVPREVAAAINRRDWTDLHRWLQEMFEHFATEMRGDIEATVTRVLREQADAAREPVAAVATPAQRRRSGPTTLLMLVLLALAGVFFWLHLDTQRKWRAAVEQNASLMAALAARRSLAVVPAAERKAVPAPAAGDNADRLAELLIALEWGVNQSAGYPPGAEPFGSARVDILEGLLERLGEIGFSGTVHFDSHVGDFCYVADAAAGLALAPEELPAERCDRIGLPAAEARLASALESVEFARLRQQREGSGPVRIEVLAHGNTMPVVPYPSTPQGVTAGEWNRIAARNNRVSVTLLPAVAAP